ncbi:MAG: ATP-binding protein, partial [Thermodesulfovibrionales bacterium]|nr:ATP-binding protein [Thermodesulfovibrionales bacterium]
EFKDFDRFRFYTSVFFLSAFAFIVVFLRQNIVMPVLRLKKATKEIEEGNFNVKVDIKNRDELGELSQSFNHMAQSLNISFSDNLRLIRNLSSLNAVISGIISDMDMDMLLKKVVDNAREFIGSRYVALGILNEQGGYERFMPSGISDEEFENMKKSHGLPRGKGILGALLIEGKPLRVDDISKHPGSAGFPKGHFPIKTFLGVPLILRNKVIGRLYFGDKLEGGIFTKEDESNALSFASVAAAAINNARLLKESALHNEELDAMNKVASVASRSLGMNEMLGAVIDELLALRPLRLEKKGAIFICDTKTKTLRLSVSRNFSEGHAKICAETRYGECLCGQCAEKGEALFSESNQEDKRHEKTYPGDILESGSHLLSLINDILDLSKVEAGKMELEPGEFSLREMLEGSLVMFKEKALKHGIKLSADVSDDIGHIIADERKIKQVVYNLLSNAVKFTPDGGAVGIEAIKLDDAVRVTVWDTGGGIKEEDLEKLFKPFQQLEASLTKEHPGTGLGLNLCKKFVELHGGRIWAESELGKGSRFTFEIPVAPLNLS